MLQPRIRLREGISIRIEIALIFGFLHSLPIFSLSEAPLRSDNREEKERTIYFYYFRILGTTAGADPIGRKRLRGRQTGRAACRGHRT